MGDLWLNFTATGRAVSEVIVVLVSSLKTEILSAHYFYIYVSLRV